MNTTQEKEEKNKLIDILVRANAEKRIDEEEKIALVNILQDYAEAELEVEDREIIEELECDWNDEENVAECVTLVERQKGDPKILSDGSRDWTTVEDVIDEGTVRIRYIADPRGTQIIFRLYRI